tara:strand:- start:1026 stop:1610 length:585 start_codon:yes stop_codon:yes gene_type:complete
MKRLLLIFAIFSIFSFFNVSKADNIKDFEIEGMTIGDSALDFFTVSHIKDNSWDYFKSKRFTPVQNDKMSFFETYDAVDFVYKTDDNKYKIVELAGVLFYDENIDECYDKLDEIALEMDKLFPFTRKEPKQTYKHSNDKTQKSLVTDIEYFFKNGDSVQLACFDYSEASGSQDHLSVALSTKEIYDFYINEAYE